MWFVFTYFCLKKCYGFEHFISARSEILDHHRPLIVKSGLCKTLGSCHSFTSKDFVNVSTYTLHRYVVVWQRTTFTGCTIVINIIVWIYVLWHMQITVFVLLEQEASHKYLWCSYYTYRKFYWHIYYRQYMGKIIYFAIIVIKWSCVCIT
jgi:hypothetical protein